VNLTPVKTLAHDVAREANDCNPSERAQHGRGGWLAEDGEFAAGPANGGLLYLQILNGSLYLQILVDSLVAGHGKEFS
jgi:hypothetical protein